MTNYQDNHYVGMNVVPQLFTVTALEDCGFIDKKRHKHVLQLKDLLNTIVERRKTLPGNHLSFFTI